MTLVEFYDGVSIDNMASCLAMKPQRVIFLGENKQMQRQEAAYRRLLDEHKLQVSFEYRKINKNSIEQIVLTLSDIVETEESCAFDLTGGDDLVLVAMGIVFEKYRNTGKIQMHRFNIRTGSVYDCDCDGDVPSSEPINLTVKENIMLYGGCIVPFDGEKGTYPWIFSDDFISDLESMWEICKQNPGLWNSQIGTFAYISKSCTESAAELDIYANKRYIEDFMKKENSKFTWVNGLLNSFSKRGLVLNLIDDDDVVSFSFKNEQVKLCLTKEGTLLELMVLLYAMRAKDKDGTDKYSDAVNGVYIDWDSAIHDISDEEKDTENEIDVVLMKGLVPIFISCKNGYVDENELYKLNTVAEKFGGPYAQKVLVATYFGKSSVEGHKYFVQRAKDMKIQLIENVHELTQLEFEKKIKNILW